MNFRPLKELVAIIMAISVVCFTFSFVYLTLLGLISLVTMQWYIPTDIISFVLTIISLVLTFFILQIAKS